MKKYMLLLAVLALLGANMAMAQNGTTTSPAPQQAWPMPVSDLESRFWTNAEYLIWGIKNGPAPVPLVTSAPATTPAFIPGALDNPDSSVVLGGQSIHHPLHHGGRFTFGGWLDEDQTVGLEACYFFLADRSVSQGAAASGAPGTVYLVNPFFDPISKQEIVNFLATPDFAASAGAAVLTNRSRLQGAECNAVAGLLNEGETRLSLLAGFRFLQLQEGLTLATAQTDPTAFFFPGQFVNTVDEFSTRNNFYGGQLGARLDWTAGRFFVQTTAKVALGSTHEVLRVSGFTTTNTGPGFFTPVPVTTVPGGIFTQPTNIGTQSQDRFAVAPEVTIQAGVTLWQRVRPFVGYNFLYLSEVARASNQIDRSINSTQLVSFSGLPVPPLAGEARPAARFNGSDFWAQGVHFGIRFDW